MKKRENEKIKFLYAKRTSWYEVKAVYSLNNENFSVFWNCIDGQTGEPLDFYYLDNKVESRNEDLMDRVIEAIKMGEDDYNKDLELYLAIRDTYDMSNAEEETHEIEIEDVLYYDKISVGLEVDACVDGEDMSFFMQLPIFGDSQISVIKGASGMGWNLLTEIASHAEKTFESNLDMFLLTQGLEKDNLKEIGNGVYLVYDTDENDVKVINKSSVSYYYNTAVYEFIDLRSDYSLNDDVDNLEEKIQAFKNEI